MMDKCFACKNLYLHDKFVNLCSGGLMKHTGDYCCTASKKHKKLNKSHVYKQKPVWCPIPEVEKEVI